MAERSFFHLPFIVSNSTNEKRSISRLIATGALHGQVRTKVTTDYARGQKELLVLHVQHFEIISKLPQKLATW